MFAFLRRRSASFAVFRRPGGCLKVGRTLYVKNRREIGDRGTALVRLGDAQLSLAASHGYCTMPKRLFRAVILRK